MTYRPNHLPTAVAAQRLARPASLQRRTFMIGGAAAAAALASTTISGTARAHDFKLGSLEIEHPWSRATPGGAKVAGGYLVIHNRGTTSDRLVSVSSPICGVGEIHEMAYANNVMTMRALPDGLEIPAGGSVALKPGSYHLMLMELKQPLKKGDQFQATLTFKNAGSVTVNFVVEAMGASGSHH